MTERDPDIECMLDILADTARMDRARRMLHAMQDHNPHLSRHEGILGMIAYSIGRIPDSAHQKFSPPMRELTQAWEKFCSASRQGEPSYTLRPELTRVLKTIHFLEMEDVLAEPEPEQWEKMIEKAWDLHGLLEKTKLRAAYYGVSGCIMLDIVHDENVDQIGKRKNVLVKRADAMTAPPNPQSSPQP